MKEELIKHLDNYWTCGRDHDLINDFINDFFSQYQPESSKREDFSYTVITNKEIEEEMKKMPQFKTYSELEGCGTPNSMET